MYVVSMQKHLSLFIFSDNISAPVFPVYVSLNFTEGVYTFSLNMPCKHFMLDCRAIYLITLKGYRNKP